MTICLHPSRPVGNGAVGGGSPSPGLSARPSQLGITCLTPGPRYSGSVRAMSGLGRLVLGTLLAGVLVAGLLLPFSVGMGIAANQVTTAIESAQSDPLDGDIPLRTTFTDSAGTPIATFYDQN